MPCFIWTRPRNNDRAMGPIAYTLCHKPLIGLAMFVSGMCAFPALIDRQPIDLTKAGATVSVPFEAPVDKRYTLDLVFAFASKEAMDRDDIVGQGYDARCLEKLSPEAVLAAQRDGFGRPTTLHVTVRRRADNVPVVDQTFVSQCTSSRGPGYTKWRLAGRIDLKRGEYVMQVTNPIAQAGLENIGTTFALVSGESK